MQNIVQSKSMPGRPFYRLERFSKDNNSKHIKPFYFSSDYFYRFIASNHLKPCDRFECKKQLRFKAARPQKAGVSLSIVPFKNN